MKIHPVGANLFMQTAKRDRQTDTMKVTGAFYTFANTTMKHIQIKSFHFLNPSLISDNNSVSSSNAIICMYQL